MKLIKIPQLKDEYFLDKASERFNIAGKINFKDSDPSA